MAATSPPVSIDVLDRETGQTGTIPAPAGRVITGGLHLSDDGRHAVFEAEIPAKPCPPFPDCCLPPTNPGCPAVPALCPRSADRHDRKPAAAPARCAVRDQSGDLGPAPTAVVSGQGVTVTAVDRLSEHELSVAITVDHLAATGTCTLAVTNSGTGPGPTAGDTGGCTCLTIT